MITEVIYLTDDTFLRRVFLLNRLMTFTGQGRLQLTKGLRQIIALGEELVPLGNVCLQQGRVLFMRQHSLKANRIG